MPPSGERAAAHKLGRPSLFLKSLMEMIKDFVPAQLFFELGNRRL